MQRPDGVEFLAGDDPLAIAQLCRQALVHHLRRQEPDAEAVRSRQQEKEGFPVYDGGAPSEGHETKEISDAIGVSPLCPASEDGCERAAESRGSGVERMA